MLIQLLQLVSLFMPQNPRNYTRALFVWVCCWCCFFVFCFCVFVFIFHLAIVLALVGFYSELEMLLRRPIVYDHETVIHFFLSSVLCTRALRIASDISMILKHSHCSTLYANDSLFVRVCCNSMLFISYILCDELISRAFNLFRKLRRFGFARVCK